MSQRSERLGQRSVILFAETDPSVKKTECGRDLVTGAEIYRKPEVCRFMGLFCGPLIITASGHSITAWEAVP